MNIDTKHTSFINPLGFDESSNEYKERVEYLETLLPKLGMPNCGVLGWE